MSDHWKGPKLTVRVESFQKEVVFDCKSTCTLCSSQHISREGSQLSQRAVPRHGWGQVDIVGTCAFFFVGVKCAAFTLSWRKWLIIFGSRCSPISEIGEGSHVKISVGHASDPSSASSQTLKQNPKADAQPGITQINPVSVRVRMGLSGEGRRVQWPLPPGHTLLLGSIVGNHGENIRGLGLHSEVRRL